MDIYNSKQRPVTKAEYDWWWVKSPCELSKNPFCHTSCPWFGECSATEELWNIEEEYEEDDNWP